MCNPWELAINENYHKNISINIDSPLLRRLSTISSEVYEVPEISKAMSREQKEDIKNFKRHLMPKLSLNYSLVRERPLSMVIYKKTEKKTNKRKKLVGFDPSLNFDINKIINKYNNHIIHEAPNFDYMTSRPYDKTNPLPNFMQKMFNRMFINKYDDKSLKLNQYSEGKFSPFFNYFFPKNSFNTIINLSLLRGTKNIEKYNENHYKKIINRIGLKNKNYEKLILDGNLDRFDKITFKTVNNNSKINKLLLKNLLMNENENIKNYIK